MLNVILLLQILYVTIIFVIGRLLYCVPKVDTYIEKTIAYYSGLDDPLIFRGKLFSLQMFYCLIYQIRNDIFKKAQCGTVAPNTIVFDENKNSYNLLDFSQIGRLLVVNFGSCS